MVAIDSMHAAVKVLVQGVATRASMEAVAWVLDGLDHDDPRLADACAAAETHGVVLWEWKARVLAALR